MHLSNPKRPAPGPDHLAQNPRRPNLLAPVLCTMVSMVGVGCVIGLIKVRYGYHTARALQTEAPSFHPTVLPFRKNRTNCEKNDSVWSNGECVDHDHSPTF